MIPILCGYHISFCYFFALEVVRGHDFWGTFENVLENIWPTSVNIEELKCEWWNGVLCGICYDEFDTFGASQISRSWHANGLLLDIDYSCTSFKHILDDMMLMGS